MNSKILKQEPTVQRSCIGRDFSHLTKISTQYIRFDYQISEIYENVKRRLIIDPTVEVMFPKDELYSSITTSTEFELFGVENNSDSYKTIEQCFYIAYSEMTKLHKEFYKDTIVLDYELPLMSAEYFRLEISEILLCLGGSS